MPFDILWNVYRIFYVVVTLSTSYYRESNASNTPKRYHCDFLYKTPTIYKSYFSIRLKFVVPLDNYKIFTTISFKMATLPTVTISELSDGIQDPTTNAAARKVLEGILNDYMDLQYGKETPYTTGKQVIPSDTTTEDLNKAIEDDTTEKIFKEMFTVISETHKSGCLEVQSQNDGSWDPKLKPVLVLVTPNRHL